MTEHTTVNVACFIIHIIPLGIYPIPPMKDTPCVPFNWICKVVNYLVQIMFKSPMRARLLSPILIFFLGCFISDADSSLACHVCYNCWHQARRRRLQLSFSFGIWYFWMKFKFLCTIFFWVYPCTCCCLSKIMMRSYIISWSTMRVMNAYADNVCIREDNTNSLK